MFMSADCVPNTMSLGICF